MTTTRDYAAEYLAARIDSRATTDLDKRLDAQRRARAIEMAADRAGVRLDITALDEQARLHLYPAGPRQPRRIGWHPITGLPIYE